jgi:hypothetical protein
MARKVVPLPNQERLQKLFDYSVITGKLYWRENRGDNILKGKEAGYTDKANKVAQVRIDNKLYLAHRVIWKLVIGKEPKECIDHVNRDSLDNSWINLREASSSENQYNRIKTKENKTGYKGVCFHQASGKFMAGIQNKRKSIYLGLFDTAEEAHAAYCAAADELHGKFARH